MAGRSVASNNASHAAVADGNWHSFAALRGEASHGMTGGTLASTSHFAAPASFTHANLATRNFAWRGGWGGWGWRGGWGWGFGFAGWNWGWGWGCCGWGWGWGWSPFWSWPAYWYNPYLEGYDPPPYALYPYPG